VQLNRGTRARTQGELDQRRGNPDCCLGCVMMLGAVAIVAVWVATASADAVDDHARVADYVREASPTADADAVADLLLAGTARATGGGCDPCPDALLLACLARYEAAFDPDADSGTCRGLLQIHRCHRAGMREMGLDYDIELDRIEFGCWLYSWHGLKPWTVWCRALRDYEEATGE